MGNKPSYFLPGLIGLFARSKQTSTYGITARSTIPGILLDAHPSGCRISIVLRYLLISPFTGLFLEYFFRVDPRQISILLYVE